MTPENTLLKSFSIMMYIVGLVLYVRNLPELGLFCVAMGFVPRYLIQRKSIATRRWLLDLLAVGMTVLAVLLLASYLLKIPLRPSP